MFIELFFKHNLSKTGVILHIIDTNIIKRALWLFAIILKLLNTSKSVTLFEYSNKVPIIIKKTPKYWIEDNFSFKKIKENIELNNGDKDNNGIVKLKSDCLIAFKKKEQI